MLHKLSENELRYIVDIMHQCLGVNHEKDLLKIMEIIKNLLPFDAAAVCSIKKVPSSNGFIHCINLGYDSEWSRLYRSKSYYGVDPVLRSGLKSNRPFTWSEARQTESHIHENICRFLKNAADFNLINGIAFCCRSSDSEKYNTLFSLHTKIQRIPENWDLILELILPHIHQAFGRVLKHVEKPEISHNLSHREIEVLKWGKEGKSSWEIGIILSISERTVKFHFQNIFKKLDVVNRPQAVAKALDIGLI